MQEPEGSLLLDPTGITPHAAVFVPPKRESVRACHGRQARLTYDAIGNAVTFGRLLLRQTYGTENLLSQRPDDVVRFIGG